VREERLMIAEGVSLAVVGGHKVLFSETRQQLFELDDAAAFIWSRLSNGAAIGHIVEEVAGRGLPDGQVQAYVNHVVSEWTRMGLLQGPPHRKRLVIGETCIEIRYATASLAGFVSPGFKHLEAMERSPDRVLDLSEQGSEIVIRSGVLDLATCGHDEIVPALRGALTMEALGHGGYEVALHTATVASSHGALLLSGCPGAGKSTLAVALAQSGLGLGLVGDDVALLRADGQVTALQFAPAVKSGSWPLLAGLCPGIMDLPVHVRYDRQQVRFPDRVPLADPSPRPIRWIVSLDRQDSAEPALKRLDPLDTLRDLIEGAASRDDRLSGNAFQAMSRALEKAECYRFTYSRLDHAVARLIELCE
jgi:hypothetical protein